MMFPPATWVTAPGLTPYETALETMRHLTAGIRAGSAPETVWLVEHPPLYTSGTSAKPADLTDPGRFPIFAAGRGGQWTYHGPGQRVAYVMLDLARDHGSVPAHDIRAYVAGLERWLIGTLAEFAVAGEVRAGRVGIWVPGERERKIAAIGVRVTRWVSWHGVSLNVAPDLSHFDGIVPCGIREHGVTSLAALGVSASFSDIDAALARNFATVFG